MGKEDIRLVGRIDRKIYQCIEKDIVTDEVIITDERIAHINEEHPGDYERFSSYFEDILNHPDYILAGNKPHTAVVLKEIEIEDERVKVVVRLATSTDPCGYKNSIITFMRINKKRWNRYLRTKAILYKPPCD